MQPDGKRIVIVEDNKGLREGFELLINATGKHLVVNTHESAELALEALNADKPEIILMDVNLPGINGIKCTYEVKKINPKVEILIITVFENSTYVFDALCAGASGYLTKKLFSNRNSQCYRFCLEWWSTHEPAYCKNGC